MKWFAIALVGWTLAEAAASNILSAQGQPASETTAIQQLPGCATACADSISRRYSCQTTDPCYCDNSSPYVLAQQACLKTKCTLDEQLEAKRFQAQTCHLPVHDDRLRIRAVVYTLFAVAVVFTAARLLSRWRRLKGAGFWWDDLAVFISSWAMIAMIVDSHFSEKYGLGRDMWDLSAYQVVHFLEWFYIAEPLYIVGTRLTKLSLVLLYLRIWEPERGSPFHIACIAVAVLLLASMIGGIFATLFQCSPVQFYWRHLIPGTQGSCICQLALSLANACIVIFLDICSLLLPLPKLWKLQTSLPTKSGISSVFLVGFAVTACSCVRMTYILEYTRSSTNITYDYTGLALWSHIEVYLSMICCSMPQVPGLLRRSWKYARNRPVPRQSSQETTDSSARYEVVTAGMQETPTPPHPITTVRSKDMLRENIPNEKA